MKYLIEKRIEDALNKSDCAVFVTDHDLSRNLNLANFKHLVRSPVIVGCKNLFNQPEDFIYLGIGKNFSELIPKLEIASLNPIS